MVAAATIIVMLFGFSVSYFFEEETLPLSALIGMYTGIPVAMILLLNIVYQDIRQRKRNREKLGRGAIINIIALSLLLALMLAFLMAYIIVQ